MGELLRKPENRCRGVSARDKYKYGVPADSISACQWCLVGALAKITGDVFFLWQSEFADQLSQYLFGRRQLILASQWDSATTEEQDRIVKALLEVDGS